MSAHNDNLFMCRNYALNPQKQQTIEIPKKVASFSEEPSFTRRGYRFLVLICFNEIHGSHPYFWGAFRPRSQTFNQSRNRIWKLLEQAERMALSNKIKTQV